MDVMTTFKTPLFTLISYSSYDKLILDINLLAVFFVLKNEVLPNVTFYEMRIQNDFKFSR